MTLGLLLGMCAAFLFSMVNLVDKYLIDRFSRESGIGALILLSSLFPATLLPIAWFLSKGMLYLPLSHSLILLCSGALTTLWVTLYLLALEDDDVSTVMPIFQLTPVAALIVGFLLLNELPTAHQLIAGAIIIFGSFVLGYEASTGKFKIKLLLMIGGASIGIACMNALFKFVASDASFWTSIFWQALGTVISGMAFVLVHHTYRRQFFTFIRENAGIGLGVNAVNETLTIAGDVLFAYAILLAPLALVQTTEAFQPIFVFFLGIALTCIAPKLFSEDLSRTVLLQKLAGITLVSLGTLFLYLL